MDHRPARLLPLALLLLLAAGAPAADGSLTIELDLGPGTGDNPMIVVWLETTAGDFVRTLQMFSKDKKYYHDMTVWWKGHDGNAADGLDAVIGPTIKWTTGKSATMPLDFAGINLLSGKYQIHIEQRRDKGGHFNTRIPLPPTFSSGTIDGKDINQGKSYLAHIIFTVKH